MTLYELTGQYMDLLNMAEDEDVDPDVLKDTLEGIDGEIEIKADGYAKVIRTMEGDEESIQSEIDRLTKKKNAIKNNIESMKNSLETMMHATGKTKFKTELFSFSVQKNPASLDVLDEQKVPADFWKAQDPKLDRKAALAYIKENGDQDWGKLKHTESLRIR